MFQNTAIKLDTNLLITEKGIPTKIKTKRLNKS